MTKIPKYKTVPANAYRYAKRIGVLSDDHEKVFIKDPPLALEYANLIKRNRLTDFVESEVCKFFYLAIEKYAEDKAKDNETIKLTMQKKFFDSLFSYIKLVKFMPKEIEEKLLSVMPEDLLVKYSISIEKRLDKKYEDFLLMNSIRKNKISLLVEYSYAIGSKLPSDMHNFIICYAINNKDDYSIKSYLGNLKKIKNTLIKLCSTFDENKSIKEIINQL